MRGLYLLPLMLQMGCVVEQPIKIYLRIVDSGITEVVGGDLEVGDEPIDDPNQSGSPTNEPSGDPNGGDPNGGEPVGQPGGDPEPSGEASGEPSGEPGSILKWRRRDTGVFDACDASCILYFSRRRFVQFQWLFNEQQECTSASSDSTYDDWFTCVVDNKGEPCSGAGGGDWSGCDCSAVQTCSDNNANPL